jgi:hypothetical protein
MNTAILSWKTRNIMLLLFLVALGIRIPFLFTVPEFRSNELDITLRLLNQGVIPLHNQHAHIGALSNYIFAAAFLIFGKHYWVQRVLILVMGSITVALLYPLGKRLVGASAAFLGSLMLAGSMYHIFELSHMPWSNSMTPFFVICFLLSLLIALEFQKSYWLIFSGFLFGLALQSHPSVITLVPFIICLFLLQGKDKIYFWLKKPAPYLMFVAGLVGYANMIYYNLVSRLGTVSHAFSKTTYSLEENRTVTSYLHNLKGESILLLRLLSGAAEEQYSLHSYFLNPFFLLLAFSLIAGIFFCIRGRKWELPLVLLFPFLIIPIVNRSYEFCKFGRYFGFLIPIMCLLSAYAAIELLNFFRSSKVPVKAAIIIWLIFPACYFGYHYDQLRKTYVELERQDQSFFVFRQVNSFLKSYDKSRTWILIDQFGWKAEKMSAFLETDGWNVAKLMLNEINRSRELAVQSVYVDSSFSNQVYDHLHQKPDLKILAFVSPIALKSFFSNAPVAACKWCAAKGPPRGTIYKELLNNIFYLFELGPAKTAANTSEDFLLNFLSITSSSLPDEKSFSPASINKKIALPVRFRERDVRSSMTQVCSIVFVPVEKMKCRICPENLSSITWDHQHQLRKLPIKRVQNRETLNLPEK